MKKKLWIRTEPFGALYMEQVLSFFDVPELFVCADDMDDKYLVVFVDDMLMKYLAVKTSPSRILAMLNGTVTMEQTFRAAEDGIAIYIQKNFETNKFDSKKQPIETVPSEDLPAAEAYYKIYNREVEDYCKLVEMECRTAQMKKALSNISQNSINIKIDETFANSIEEITSSFQSYYQVTLLASKGNVDWRDYCYYNYNIEQKEGERGEEPVSVYQSVFTKANSAA